MTFVKTLSATIVLSLMFMSSALATPDVYVVNASSAQEAHTLNNTPLPPQIKYKFDPKGVDKKLYRHQKVGRPYSIMGKKFKPKHDPNYDKVGIASWYGDKFHGKRTVTGEIFDKDGMTAAHKTLPLNSLLYVTNEETGKSIIVRLNDRGPFTTDRIIDLSEGAAKILGMKASGLAKVRVQYAGPADPLMAK